MWMEQPKSIYWHFYWISHWIRNVQFYYLLQSFIYIALWWHLMDALQSAYFEWFSAFFIDPNFPFRLKSNAVQIQINSISTVNWIVLYTSRIPINKLIMTELNEMKECSFSKSFSFGRPKLKIESSIECAAYTHSHYWSKGNFPLPRRFARKLMTISLFS